MQYRWDEEKNKILKKIRDCSFEDVIACIENGGLLDVIEHHNKVEYPNQKILVVKIQGYVYYVPFVEEIDGKYFLKTIYPTRTATKKYLK